MAVIAALKFNGDVTAGKAARDAQGAHRSFGAGIDEPNHLNGRDEIANEFGELDFAFGGRAKASADFERQFDGLDDGGMTVSQEQRAPGTDVVDELVAIGVPEPGSLAACDEGGRSADAAVSADGRIDAAGNGCLARSNSC